jgi:hypothetical protein
MGRDYASIAGRQAAPVNDRNESSESSASTEQSKPDERSVEERHVLALRVGHGANCSSIGSVVDTLFASAVVGAMVFAAAVAAMKSERVTIARLRPGAGAPRREPAPPQSGDGPGTTRSG